MSSYTAIDLGPHGPTLTINGEFSVSGLVGTGTIQSITRTGDGAARLVVQPSDGASFSVDVSGIRFAIVEGEPT